MIFKELFIHGSRMIKFAIVSIAIKSCSSVKYWNSLPDHIRKTVDYSEFKRKLLVHGFS